MFPDFLDLFLHAVHEGFDLYLFRSLSIQPIHAGDVGAEVETKFGAVSQKYRRLFRQRVLGLNQ